MRINISSDYTTYNHLSKLDAGRGPRYIKKPDKEESGADAVELSEEGRMKFLEKKDSMDKILSRLHMSRDILNDIKTSIYDSDYDYKARQARIYELRAEISQGTYDFDSEYRLALLADALLSYKHL